MQSLTTDYMKKLGAFYPGALLRSKERNMISAGVAVSNGPDVRLTVAFHTWHILISPLKMGEFSTKSRLQDDASKTVLRGGHGRYYPDKNQVSPVFNKTPSWHYNKSKCIEDYYTQSIQDPSQHLTVEFRNVQGVCRTAHIRVHPWIRDRPYDSVGITSVTWGEGGFPSPVDKINLGLGCERPPWRAKIIEFVANRNL